MAAAGPDSPTPLERRLRAAAAVLLPDTPGTMGAAGAADAAGTSGTGALDALDAGSLLDLLVRDVQADPRADRLWLLCAAVSTVLPAAGDIVRARRAMELREPDEAAVWLLDDWAARTREQGRPHADIEIVTGRVLVDVDFTARHDLNTGVQRVVRSLLPLWAREHDVLPVAWTESFRCYRELTPLETDRTLNWHVWHATSKRSTGAATDLAADETTLVVPWRCTIVLPEVPPRPSSDSLAALAELSGSDVVAVGHDCIPVVNASLVQPAEPDRFIDYLHVVKHLRRVAAVSVSAAREFRGFSDMLRTQGLVGPRVVECLEPSPVLDGVRERSADADPLVISVGSFEPRKNQLALLFVAETLWREGLRFRLTFVGGGGWDEEFPERVKRLSRAGRVVTVARAIGDDELNALYAEARFSVFTSLHEGYGLPVAESLAHGTPVLTTEYGSTAEIGADGGAVLVDPRNDDALVSAMRELLTDDTQIAKLRDAIGARPTRDWQAYADELWTALVTGTLAEPAPAAAHAGVPA